MYHGHAAAAEGDPGDLQLVAAGAAQAHVAAGEEGHGAGRGPAADAHDGGQAAGALLLHGPDAGKGGFQGALQPSQLLRGRWGDRWREEGVEGVGSKDDAWFVDGEGDALVLLWNPTLGADARSQVFAVNWTYRSGHWGKGCLLAN